MIDVYQIQEILTQYKKHGWNLSRVLLSAGNREKLTVSPENIFGSAEIVDSEIRCGLVFARCQPVTAKPGSFAG